NGGTFNLGGQILTLNSVVFSGAGTVTAGTITKCTISVSNGYTFLCSFTLPATVTLSGLGGLTVNAGGLTTTLLDTGNYTGVTKVMNGTLALGNSAAIGDNSVGNEIQVLSGGQFRILNGVTVSKSFTISGSGNGAPLSGAIIFQPSAASGTAILNGP